MSEARYFTPTNNKALSMFLRSKTTLKIFAQACVLAACAELTTYDVLIKLKADHQ